MNLYMIDKINYQLTYLISPELNLTEVEELLKKIESLILKFGKILKSENPKKIKLSYPIQKKREAFLNFLEFKGEVNQIDNLKKEVEKEKNILRYLLTKKKEIEKKIREPKEVKIKTPETKEIKEKKKVELKDIEEKLGEILK